MVDLRLLIGQESVESRLERMINVFRIRETGDCHGNLAFRRSAARQYLDDLDSTAMAGLVVIAGLKAMLSIIEYHLACATK